MTRVPVIVDSYVPVITITGSYTPGPITVTGSYKPEKTKKKTPTP